MAVNDVNATGGRPRNVVSTNAMSHLLVSRQNPIPAFDTNIAWMHRDASGRMDFGDVDFKRFSPL